MLDLDAIAAEYASAPVLDPQHAKLWANFATYNVRLAHRIGQQIHVVPTDDPEPYATSADQSADILAGRFLVSRAHCNHPVWLPWENVAFRVVHDVLGHHAIRAGFDRAGEIAVYEHDLARTPARFRPCLFTESVGQLAYAVLAGDFGPQKVYVSAFGPSMAG